MQWATALCVQMNLCVCMNVCVCSHTPVWGVHRSVQVCFQHMVLCSLNLLLTGPVTFDILVSVFCELALAPPFALPVST